jgi:hypothetical protein
VLYRFKGLLHEVCVADKSPLTIPLMRDKLPDAAARVVNGALLVQVPSSLCRLLLFPSRVSFASV